jgi:site-specific recombinase XerD
MKISPQNIKNDERFKNFIKERKLRESTEIIYSRRLSDFCEFIGKTPAKLIEEALKEHNLKSEEHEVYNNIETYLDVLKEEGKSFNTIKNRYDTLKAFFKEFNIDMPNINNPATSENENLIIGIPTINHVKKAVQISGLRDKSIILLHFTSSMGAIELRYLTYGDFINSVDEYLDLSKEEKLDLSIVTSKINKIHEPVGTWKIKKLKSGIYYTTFNSPESTHAILDYLMEREMNNKPIKSFEDPLFVNTWNKPLTKSVHGAIFKRINDKAGFKHLEGKRRFFTSGTLRKTFEKSMYKAGLNKITIDSLLGYKINNPNTLENLKNQYIISLEFLRLENPNDGASSEFEMLMSKFNEKDEELKQIREHVKYLEEMVKKMS